MDNHQRAADFQHVQVEALRFENLVHQRFNIFSAIVVLLILTSGVAVGARWWAQNLYP